MNSIIMEGVLLKLFDPEYAHEDDTILVGVLPDGLRQAIERYFEFKSTIGVFRDNQHREEFYKPIIDEAHKLGLSASIIPGLIILHGDDIVYTFDSNHPQGIVDANMTKRMRGIR